jgi:hypothetical protein
MVDKVALGQVLFCESFGFPLSLSSHQCFVLIFIYMLLLPDGQTGKDRKPSKIRVQCCFGKKGTLGRKILSRSLSMVKTDLQKLGQWLKRTFKNWVWTGLILFRIDQGLAIVITPIVFRVPCNILNFLTSWASVNFSMTTYSMNLVIGDVFMTTQCDTLLANLFYPFGP